MKSYEKGGLTRRDLIRGLTMLGGWDRDSDSLHGSANTGTDPMACHCATTCRSTTADPQRGAEFYQEVMGLKLLRQGPPNDRDCCPEDSAFLGVGDRLVLALRNNEPYGVIDHWSMMAPGYTPDRFRAAIEERGGEIAQHGLGGQYVRDPDGAPVSAHGELRTGLDRRVARPGCAAGSWNGRA